MIFFEPTVEDDSYSVYKDNVSWKQNLKDKAWHGVYKNMWKALINTVKARRIIQKEMYNKYPNAVDKLFHHSGLSTKEKFDREELEVFMKEQNMLDFDYEHSKCLLSAIDRDQDNLASYEEIHDAMYGAD